MVRRRERPPFWFEETFDRIRKLQEDIFRAFDEFWRPPFEFEFEPPRVSFSTTPQAPVDVSETPREVIVRIDLPGFRKEDIRLKATETELIVEAERKEERKEEKENFFRQERRYGAVRRVIPLPVPVIPEKAKARFENGVLEVRLEKAEPEEEKEKEIKIE